MKHRKWCHQQANNHSHGPCEDQENVPDRHQAMRTPYKQRSSSEQKQPSGRRAENQAQEKGFPIVVTDNVKQVWAVVVHFQYATTQLSAMVRSVWFVTIATSPVVLCTDAIIGSVWAVFTFHK